MDMPPESNFTPWRDTRVKTKNGNGNSIYISIGDCMSLGLDIHGVIDTNPDEFIQLAKDVRRLGGKVHIITGSSYDDDLDEYLLSLSKGEVFWDKLVSVQDRLTMSIDPVGINKYGRPYWNDEDWDRVKGDYCRENNIDIHYDDTERYGDYFPDSTQFVLYKE